jgi:hypothetical protein
MNSSSDLLFARNKQTNAIIGGGYTLNSSFLNANISPFVQMQQLKGGGRSRSRRNRSDRSKSDRSDRSKSDRSKSDRSDINDTDDDDDDELKVSTLLERANSNKFIIPAGIFMIHPSSQIQEGIEETVPMSTKLKDFIYSTEHDNNNNNAENYDHQEQVVPSDLYEKLLSMISPADKKRYWDPKSITRKRGNRNQDVSPSSIKSKTRRKL